MSAAPNLPRLLSAHQLAAEMNIKQSSAENLMRKVPKFHIGRRVYVLADDIAAYIEREKRQ